MSVDTTKLEHMFDGGLPGVAQLGDLSARELVDAARGWARAENAAAARKLAVMAEIFTRRTGVGAQDRDDWWVDPDAAVAAELAAALALTHGLALHQAHRAVTLRDRLPQVAALFADGVVSDMVVRKIVFRTGLIVDTALMALVDAAIAGQARRWGALSEKKLEQAIDATVIAHDPAAQRRVVESLAVRRVDFGAPGDAPGFTTVWARMLAGDAAALQDRIERIAHTVCAGDPRTVEQRRNDALGAIGVGVDALVCQCGTADCEAGSSEPAARNTTIYVIADAETLAAAQTEQTGQPEPAEAATAGRSRAGCAEPTERVGEQSPPEPTAPEPAVPEPAASRPTASKPALLLGVGMLPAVLLDPMLGRAHIRRIVHPGESPAQDRYLPSRTLAEFIRCRDVTCRFPFCDVPATEADIDHTVAYPVGPTHASNLKCLCRFHHLVKTFWGGRDGWRDRQLPDGTVIWTSPTGHTYTTYPGSLTLFPSLCRPTGILWTGDPPTPNEHAGRDVKMPRRRHTRAHNRARTIAAQRKLNGEHTAEENKSPPF